MSYNKIMSKSSNYTLHNRKVIYKVILIGTYLVIVTVAILLWISFSLHQSQQLLDRLIVCGLAVLYIAISHMLFLLRRYLVASYLLIIFYTLLATGITWSWGIHIPISPLIFGLVIVLAGILLSARHALFAAILCALLLIGIQTNIFLGWHAPDTSWALNESSFGDVSAYIIIFSMLALVSWLYNREIERSLAQALRAEKALLRQKANLKLQVEKRTAELKKAQLEEMRQMYRFAELGQLGVTSLHDLANHLSVLTLEIEGLQNTRHSQDIARAQQITNYLDNLVNSMRERLHGRTPKQSFDIIQKINETVDFLRYRAIKAGVVIDWQPPTNSWKYTGDPTCLSQVIAIILNNAIDAYAPLKDKPAESRVAIAIERNNSNIVIKISDWGKGIAKNERTAIFKPFHSTKKTGLGLGLFIAKQTMETNFSGTITLNPHSSHTEFMLKLPLNE